MTGVSSTPRGEHTPRPGITWQTELVRTETVIDDNAPDPRPNRATRRSLARSTEDQVTDPRQPAYDAVLAYIHSQPRDFLPTTVVDRNAMIWRAVHTALDAMGVPGPAATQATGFVPYTPPHIPKPGNPDDALVVEPYRNDQGQNVWVFRCWGTDTCDGWLSLDHYSQQSAERARDRHVAEAHANA